MKRLIVSAVSVMFFGVPAYGSDSLNSQIARGFDNSFGKNYVEAQRQAEEQQRREAESRLIQENIRRQNQLLEQQAEQQEREQKSAESDSEQAQLIENLVTLDSLREQGVITDDEFAELKRKLLNSN